MYATRHLDWLSLTFWAVEDVRNFIPGATWHFVGSGRHGYTAAYEDGETGARYETASAIEGMDTHITLSGATLHALRSRFADGDNGIIAYAARQKARCSRIDLAINIHQGLVTVRDFYDAYKSGALKTQFRRVYYVEGMGTDRAGDTLYLGSPQSDRQVRIYNKAAEQGIVDGDAWIRLEIALRDLRAKAALAAAVDNGTSATISAHMASVLQFSNSEFNASLEDSSGPIAEIPRRIGKTERWLRDQCAPTLARIVASNPDFMVDFMASFQSSLDEIKSKG